MYLKKLFDIIRSCKKYRNDYKIIWNFYAFVDHTDYLFCLLPTIYWQPWPFRQRDISVLEIQWLHMHVCLFKWVSIRDWREENE